VLLGALFASAETRPQYGGTLHLMMRAAPSSLDPGDTTQPDSFARRTIASLLFDTLVTADQNGRATPALALSWQSSRGNQRVQFRLRPGVKFQDGTPLTPEIAASSLRRVNPAWNVISDGDSVAIEGGGSEAELLQKLTLPRNSIVRGDSEDKLSGTGPFQVVEWQPGKRLTLAAHDNCWRGRPFVDGIEISLGASFRDQMTAIELGKAEIVEVAPDQVSHISQDRFRLARSTAMSLMALVFARDAANDGEKTLRQALGLSVGRASMQSVLLQGSGQATAALLPTWMSGYGFVFSVDADIPKARQLRDSVQPVPTWALSYDSSDPLSRLLTERIALNARDAGLTLRPMPSNGADLRLIQIPLASPDPWIALNELLDQLGMPAPQRKGRSTEDLYSAEQSALATERVIPLFHLPASYAAQTNLRGWMVRSDGSVDLASAWLKSGQP
jgi:ABC-type transport system substrate-binding protein